ncbi:uncharacterized protein LOC109864148 [Pseudomyrmex gracilis]|uniref:uncharacterized protein LOC109864148 n=1 Tax=Pseudomyrmex gracilis TaxID=219809 RepID=UPI000995D0A7|nr:uncharacterized protein LOC109864148 [Pseudomyrmex gracilis]
MSCQRGNASRSRPPKHQNHKAFKNDMHDTSQKIKLINSIEVVNVCERCKQILEWKIKYKKYKILKAPIKCIKCSQKSVKHSYHNICLPCAKEHGICPKCGLQKQVIEGKPTKTEQLKLDAEVQVLLKTMSERKRRTLIRYMNQQSTKEKQNKNRSQTFQLDTNEKDANEDSIGSRSGIDLLSELKLLAIKEDYESEEFDENNIFNNETKNEEKNDNDNYTVIKKDINKEP